MSHLVDVNVLLAAIWRNHPQHAQASAWLKDKIIAVCPISELGFLRISTNRKAINVSMQDARGALQKFLDRTRARLIADDLPPLASKPDKSEQVTDFYLADLAEKHGLRLGTFDADIKHKVVDLIT